MSRKKGKRSRTTTRARRWLIAATSAGALGMSVLALVVWPSEPVRQPPAAVRLALPPLPVPRPAPAAPAVLPPVLGTPGPIVSPAVMPPAAVVPAPVRPPERPAWQRHAVTAPAFDGRPLIAIVIDDLGVDRRRSARAVSLPGPLTLAWLPYATEVGRQAAAGQAAGHETLLHAPMQPQGTENPGPFALTVDLPADELRRRVSSYLALLPAAVGLNNHMGSQFTRDARAMAPVVAELKERGLLFLDSLTSGASVAADTARAAGVPFAVRDVFLDNEQTPDYVRARLAELEAVARRRRIAVGIGHPHDATLNALDAWLRELPARGFVLAPISAIVRFRLEHPELAARH